MPTALRMRPLFVLLVLCVCTCRPGFAQMETATLNGVIQDPHGAVVPDVEVTATRIETGTVTTTKTNGAGIYVFTGLMPGHYHLTVRKPGFKEIAIKEFQLYVQDKSEQNFALELGSVSETVTVSASDLTLNTTDASVGTVIDRNFVGDLPLNGRSFNTLLQLTPGVTVASSNSLSPGQFSVAGQRTDANNFTVDGVSVNFGVTPVAVVVGSGAGQAQAFSALGGTSGLVSVDALQEFRVETSSFAPEFGRTPGGQVILTTRSGANDFHGGIYEYFRNDVLDANTWINNDTIDPATGKGIPRAPERHNDFGGFFGGPILRNSTFFFLSYEGARLREPQSLQTTVPSVAARSSAPTQVAPLLNAFPIPNGAVSSDGTTALFTGSYSNPATLNSGSIRIDHSFGKRFSIFGRYNNAPSEVAARAATALSEVDTTKVNTQTLTVGLLMQLKAQLSNSVRFNWSKQNSSLISVMGSFGGAVPPDPSLLIGSLPASNSQGALLLELSGGVGLYIFGPSGRNTSTQFNVVDDLALTLGTHQLKFGGDYRAIYLDAHSYEHQLFYLTDISTLTSASAATIGSGQTVAPTQILSRALSLYAQDSWKARPKLTVTYGVRWEVNPAPSPRGSTVLASWMNVNNPAQLALAPSGAPVWNTVYHNFAPRIGVAYSPRDNGDFVVRAGFGLFYDLGVGQAGELTSAFPNFASLDSFFVPLPVGDPTLLLPVLGTTPYAGTLVAFSPDLKLPRSYQWNVAIEKSFGGKQAISATYVGQAGRDLLRNAGMNQPNSNFAPGSVFQLTDNSATSDYDALQVQYRRPLSNRLQALLNYSWAHSLDNVSNDTVVAISDTVFSNQHDRASSDFDVRHTFSGALTYALPAAGKSGVSSILTRDWSIQTVVVARSGFPFNAVVPSPPVSGTPQRPDVTGKPVWLYGSQYPGGRAINPDAFTIPPSTRQGTEGRNDIRGFGLTQVDLSVERSFPITERVRLQFRTDAFNVLNHPNFTNPSPLFNLQSQSMLNQGLGGLNSLFQVGGPRSLQLSLKLTF